MLIAPKPCPEAPRDPIVVTPLPEFSAKAKPAPVVEPPMLNARLVALDAPEVLMLASPIN